MTPDLTIDREPLRKRFEGALVGFLANGKTSILIPGPPRKQDTFYVDLVSGYIVNNEDLKNYERIIRPGDACDVDDYRGKPERCVYYGFSGSTEHPFRIQRGWIQSHGTRVMPPITYEDNISPASAEPATDSEATADEAALKRLWERGKEAWKNIGPSATAWVDEMRGNVVPAAEVKRYTMDDFKQGRICVYFGNEPNPVTAIKEFLKHCTGFKWFGSNAPAADYSPSSDTTHLFCRRNGELTFGDVTCLHDNEIAVFPADIDYPTIEEPEDTSRICPLCKGPLDGLKLKEVFAYPRNTLICRRCDKAITQPLKKEDPEPHRNPFTMQQAVEEGKKKTFAPTNKSGLYPVEGKIIAYDCTNKRGYVKILEYGRGVIPFSGHCFYPSAAMPTPVINGKVLVTTNKEGDAIFVYPLSKKELRIRHRRWRQARR